MAIVNENATVKLFNNGGKIIFYTAADTGMDLLNFVKGTLKIMPPYREPVVYTDRNVVQAPLAGEGKPGEFSLTLRAGDFDSSSAWKSFCDKVTPSSSSHAHPTYTSIDIVYLDGPGATAGKKLTLTTAWLTKAPELSDNGSDNTDVYTLTGQFLTGGNVEASYSAS